MSKHLRLVLCIVGFVLLAAFARQRWIAGMSFEAPTQAQCEARRYPLISPAGKIERIAQPFVAQAFLHGYGFPEQAEMIIIAKATDPLDTCSIDWVIPVAAAPQAFREGALFRGWRRMTDEERRQH